MDITSHNLEFEKIITHLRLELGALRTGRATPALVENIPVEVYGAKQPLKAMGSIMIGDPKTLFVDVWDKTILKDVEKAISMAQIGVMPVVDGQRIRISLPPMTEESRKVLVKVLHEKSEEARVTVRTLRDKIKSSIVEAERDKEMSEDERYTLQKELEDIVKKYNDQIKEIGDGKEKEIMTV